MRARALAAFGLVAILVGAQGCTTGAFGEFLLNLFIAAGRVPGVSDTPCTEQTYHIAPGFCAFLTPNTCRTDGQFVPGDSFAFDDPPDWLSVMTFGDISRDICVAADAPLVGATFAYTYVADKPQGGKLTVITAAQLLSVQASATPGRVTAGQPLQLGVTVFGGLSPYHFAWTLTAPAGPVVVFNDPTLQNPMATISAPLNTPLTFKVTVTDAAGQTADSAVGVDLVVPLRVTLTATPSTIAFGDASQLLAVIEGGRPPYLFFWDGGDLSDFAILNPIATPRVTTVYGLSVSDFGIPTQRASSSVTVTVLPPPASDQVDIAVSLAVSPNPVVINRLLTSTTTVTNNGPAAATNVVVRVVFPSTIETNGPTPSQGTCAVFNSAAFECTLGTLPGGGTATIGLQAFPFQPGNVSFTSLLVSVTEVDSNPDNNRMMQQATVIPPN